MLGAIVGVVRPFGRRLHVRALFRGHHERRWVGVQQRRRKKRHVAQETVRGSDNVTLVAMCHLRTNERLASRDLDLLPAALPPPAATPLVAEQRPCVDRAVAIINSREPIPAAQ